MATKKAVSKKGTTEGSPAKRAVKNTPSKAVVKRASTKPSAREVPARKVAAKKSTRTVGTEQGAASRARSAAAKTPKKTAAKVAGKHAAPSRSSSADKYTNPALRECIKTKIVREGKGGRPGQWSARKAQMVAHEYEAEGGKYKGGRDETQKSLTAWGDEHWTTQDGKPAKRKAGMHRYLPEKAWSKLSAAEKRSTEKKKLEGDRKGKQFVANTGAAVKARRGAEKRA